MSDHNKSTRIHLLKSALDKLPEPPPPTADGKTPGQVAYSAMEEHQLIGTGLVAPKWEQAEPYVREKYIRMASAVLAAFGGADLEAAIARMEAVSIEELWDIFVKTSVQDERFADMKAVRARLLAAAREGQPAAVDWKAKYEEAQAMITRWEKAAEQNCTDATAHRAQAEKAEAELARIVAAAHEVGWNGVENSKDLAQFIKDQDETLEKWADYIHPEQHDRIVKGVQDRAKAAIAEARQEGLSTLRPISEAGEVPAGCVRVFGKLHDDGDWIVGTLFVNGDTHFADILPPEAKAPAVEAAKPAYIGYMTDEMPDKPTPPTFTAHDKTWNVHVPGDPMPCDENRAVEVITQKAINEKNWFSCPHDSSYWEWNHGTKITGWRYADEPTPAEPVKPWTPAVGDVVTLKSGGDKLTIASHNIDADEWNCVGFSGGCPSFIRVPAVALQPA